MPPPPKGFHDGYVTEIAEGHGCFSHVAGTFELRNLKTPADGVGV